MGDEVSEVQPCFEQAFELATKSVVERAYRRYFDLRIGRLNREIFDGLTAKYPPSKAFKIPPHTKPFKLMIGQEVGYQSYGARADAFLDPDHWVETALLAIAIFETEHTNEIWRHAEGRLERRERVSEAMRAKLDAREVRRYLDTADQVRRFYLLLREGVPRPLVLQTPVREIKTR